MFDADSMFGINRLNNFMLKLAKSGHRFQYKGYKKYVAERDFVQG